MVRAPIPSDDEPAPGVPYVLVVAGEVCAAADRPELLLGAAGGPEGEGIVLPLREWQIILRGAERIHRWSLQQLAARSPGAIRRSAGWPPRRSSYGSEF
jgi:hypothetical protein